MGVGGLCGVLMEPVPSRMSTAGRCFVRFADPSRVAWYDIAVPVSSVYKVTDVFGESLSDGIPMVSPHTLTAYPTAVFLMCEEKKQS